MLTMNFPGHCLSVAVARMSNNVMTIVWIKYPKICFYSYYPSKMKITRHNDLADIFPWLVQPLS